MSVNEACGSVLVSKTIVNKTNDVDSNAKNNETNLTIAIPPKQTQIRYGPTEPMSLAPSSRAELVRTEEFLKYFETLNVMEPKKNLSQKIILLDKLNKVVKSWMIELMIKQRIPECVAREIGGHIRTFGSYRLGVQTVGGDIDAIVISAMHIHRKDFFTTFVPYLRARSDVKNLRCVPDAYVPVMKFTFCGTEIDLLFCRIHTYKVPEDMDLSDPALLRGMETKDIRSINGFRVADEILNSVPDAKRFKAVLYAVKHWSKVHGLYSNILGFFGGITWAILTARLCQLYPNLCITGLLGKFFYLYSKWNWEQHPIILKRIIFAPNGMTLPQWSTLARDRNTLASIITPTYPEQNTCHNLTFSTRSIITQKLQEANEIIQQIHKGECTYKKLFTAPNFFSLYIHYIVVTTHSETDKNLLEWNGFIESRVRLLIGILEQNIFIRAAHPNSTSFDPLPTENLKHAKRWFVGLGIKKSKDDTKILIDLSKERNWFEQEVYFHGKAKQNFPDKHMSFAYVKRKQLKEYLPTVEIGRRPRPVATCAPKPTDESNLDNLMPIPNKRKHVQDDCGPDWYGDRNAIKMSQCESYATNNTPICNKDGKEDIIKSQDPSFISTSNAIINGDGKQEQFIGPPLNRIPPLPPPSQ